jgi:predicted transcriptional regulator
MPAKSAAQEHFMEAAYHNPEFASTVGIPKSVAIKFVKGDSDPICDYLEAASRGDHDAMKRHIENFRKD